MRQFTDITISRFTTDNWISNVGIINVPITQGSRRKFHLMSEDSITLNFSLDAPVEFLIGDFITDEIFGTFVLREKQLPTYNKTTGGYDYQLRFDRAYWLWENHLDMLTTPMSGADTIEWSEDGGTTTLDTSNISRVGGKFPYKRAESVWCLTNSLAYHVEQILFNILAADLTYYGRPYNARILPSAKKAKEIRFINYDDTHICEALTQIANEFECEWWVTYEGSPAVGYINFGKCELANTPLDFELGVNVETMQASRDLTNFANRLYVFGGTQNMPENYRKKLLLTIDTTDTIDGHVVWKDSTRQINPYTMLLDEGTVGTRPEFQFPMISQANVVSSSTPGDNEIVNDTATSQYPGKSVVKYRAVALRTTDSSVMTFGYKADAEVQYNSFSAGLLFMLPANSNSKVDAELRLFFENVDDTSDKIYISAEPYRFATIVSNINSYSIVSNFACSDFAQGGSTTIKGGKTYKFVLEAVISFHDIAVSFLNDPSYDYTLISEFGRSLYLPVGKSFAARILWDGNIYPVTFNPAKLVDGEDNADAFSLPSVYPGWGVGETVELLDYYAYAIPTAYYTDDMDDPSSLIGLGERRLRLPTIEDGEADEDGIIVKDGYAEVDGVLEVQRDEMVVKNDNIYPKCYLRVTDVSTRQMTDTMKYADDTEYKWDWTAYTIKAELVTAASDKTFPFKASYVKEGEKLKASFLSDYNEQRAYHEMGVNWTRHDDGYLLAGMTFEVAFRDTFSGGEYTLIRNEDYGAKLPSSALKPNVGDTFILTGWDVKAMEALNLVSLAESQLASFAKSYLKAMQEDGWLFRCGMMTDIEEPLYAEGTKVKVYHDALSGGYKLSRIIGYELKLDFPKDSPVYEIGETEAYSRLKAIERSMSKADGGYLGNITESDDVMFVVSLNLVNVTTNAPSMVYEGNSLVAVLTGTGGNRVQANSVVVTMGGADITASAYNHTNKTINIAEVTGNVSITAVGRPYDAKVEYLQGNGTPHLDTGIYGTPDLYTQLVFQSLQVSVGKAIFGAYSGNSSYYLYQSGANPPYWQTGFGAVANTNKKTDTNKHTIEYENYKIRLDGTQVSSYSTVFTTTSKTLLLYNIHKADGTLYSAVGLKIYSCKMIKGGVTVRDFIPVRKDGVGYLYDKVSGELFGNANSSGAFAYGNDK